MAGTKDKKPTRDRILEKAIEVFALKGYESTNLTDISSALNLTRRPLYYYFTDKYGLYCAAYEKWELEFASEMERILSETRPVMETYREIITFCISSYRSYAPNFFVGICTIPVLDELRKRYYSLEADIFRKEVELTRAAMDRGELKKNCDPAKLVSILFSINDGLRTGLEREGTGIDPRDLDELITIQLSGIEYHWSTVS
ncbi:MAG: TetR/AcrR family transcriptional regulator [Spirochaetales bacterium]|nr:TetR/AcrR family transcriptional regulator [Spirochaetales bacterium]